MANIMEIISAIRDVKLSEAADWASVVSLFLTVVSLWMIGSVKKNVVAFKGRARIQQLISDIETIPDDAIPLSQASKGKFKSLRVHLPNAWLPVPWAKKCRVVRQILSAMKEERVSDVKEGIKDYISMVAEI
jgi:hypothetical protein